MDTALNPPSALALEAPGPSYWQVEEHRWRWAGIVLLSIIFTFLVREQGVWWKNLLLSLLTGAGHWEANVRILLALRRRFPAFYDTRKRLLLHLFYVVLFSLAFNLVVALAVEAWGLTDMTFGANYLTQLWYAALPTLVITSIYESAYFFLDWRTYSIRAAMLEKETAVSQLEALKQQVDPHFLFNSLNTMAALIGDNEPAQEFLSELACLYRYVLLSKNVSTVTLAQELEFVEAYLYLSKVRFKDKIQLTQELSAEALALRVPPVAVQLLVENAIKHNAFSVERPLRIRLCIQADYLSVCNNTQAKVIVEKSTKQGLQNIVSRFGLLTERTVSVTKRPGEFEVILPLLPAV